MEPKTHKNKEPEIKDQVVAEAVDFPEPEKVELPEGDARVDNGGIAKEEPIVEPLAPVIGVVTNCARLNLRAEADGDAEVITTIDANTEVSVDMENSTDLFYKVCLPSGIEGFCVKIYIAIRQ